MFEKIRQSFKLDRDLEDFEIVHETRFFY